MRINEAAPAGTTKAMIIDGQQRLTTLTILLIALRDFAIKNPGYQVNPDKITNTFLINQYECGDAKYKLLLTQSDKSFLVMQIDSIPIPDDHVSRIHNNYLFFYKKIEKLEINPYDLYNAIGKLEIVDIELDRRYDKPQSIFESLNSTGMDLNDSDLIRNYLLMDLDAITQLNIYNNIWRPTEKLFKYENQSVVLDSFFRDYLTMKLGHIVNKNKVYIEFKNYSKSSGLTI